MSDLSRRGFLGAAAAVTGGAVVDAALPATGAQASPGHRPYGDLRDVRHVVILMQENRSFDHYFGSLKGVRGFGDRSTITLPGGLPVFRQPATAPGAPVTSTQYPWPLAAAPVSAYPAGHQPPDSETGAQGYGGTSHSWDDQHLAWNGGLMNGWMHAKGGPTTLGYLERKDIPFHYALADLYTVGDAYHCSVLSATGPNRTYLWGGTIDAQRKFSDFVAYNGGDERGKFLPWESYAETLQKAGVSWRVYQCEDDYGDNGAEYYATFAKLDPTQGGTAEPGNVFYENGVKNVPEPLTGISANADNLASAIKADVLAGTLPRVSWVVTNQAFSEHPDGAPNDGAYYIKGVLDALNADPGVFDSTLVIINYDENDGQFDHVPPPVPAPGTKDEFYAETSGPLAGAGITQPLPVGLGFRVPLLLLSPWTRGGWVTSEVSDHTSVIQFLEKWTMALGTPAICPNISDWRRSVCGDLTAALDFTSPVYGLPDLPPVTVIGDPPGGSYQPPATTNGMPAQEPGTRRARALPYQPNANLDGFTGNRANLSFTNSGPQVRKASHFSVYDNTAPARTLADYPAKLPGQYTVAPSRTATGSVEVTGGEYDLTVVGPNRFLRHFTGDLAAAGKTAEVSASYYGGAFGPKPHLVLELVNTGPAAVTFTVAPDNYAKDRPKTYRVPAHGRAVHVVDPLATSGGWYDVSVTLQGDASWSRRYVGHLEDGTNSITG
ncbi:phosphocholine-specific phospholipase C [Amycolatopsis alkalitolerans]|uniref:phospholipase C n=1 Tax=Amycolatopsis alkalitolerans TaxID=2547244 RepID=A0A5C4LVX3_9PSEU|nr:phospholipase C, phosphocholine-specific [Amycolatopsis alkalitolerans]TNC20489.1 phospholipase C, phosphocholine-specific [Amycolatopsis alkalitolerans]